MGIVGDVVLAVWTLAILWGLDREMWLEDANLMWVCADPSLEERVINVRHR